MKRLKFLTIILSLMVGIGIMASPAGATLLVYGENILEFKNVECVFDRSGNEIPFTAGGTPPLLNIGDHFVGIISIQGITDFPGTQHWWTSPTDQLSGIFAQRIEAIYHPGSDPYDPTNTQTHLTLGAPTISNFNTLAGGTFQTKLTGNEMFAMYHDTGATPFESNGSIVDDVAKSIDGIKWLSLGFSKGADLWYETLDDTGYGYSHSTMGNPVATFTGQTWLGMDIIYNDTGWVFPGGLNDPNEFEVVIGENPYGYLPPGFTSDFYMTGHLEGNPPWINDQGGGVYGSHLSPWVFRSHDPAHLNAVPEPATMLLLGSGLIGLAGFARRKKSKKVS